MSLTIRDVQYFLAVAQSGLLSTAAAHCGVTQPALTKAVRRVEVEFGLQLFERTTRGMALTSAGMRVLSHLQRLSSDYSDTALLANEMRAQQTGLLRLGVTDTTATNPVIPALSSLLTKRPAFRVQLHVDRSDAVAAKVAAGDLDLALIPAYEGQPLAGECTSIDNDPLVPVVRRGHPLARAGLTLQDLVSYGWVLSNAESASYRVLAAIFTRAELPEPRVVLEIPHASNISFGVLLRTDFLSLVPTSALRGPLADALVMLRLPELRVPRTVVLLTRANSPEGPLLRDFKELLKHAPRSD